MGRHTSTPTISSQAAHPWRATLRTMLATGIPVFAGAVYVLPEIIQIILDELGAVLPDGTRLWLIAAAAICTATAGAITRIMAIPRIVQLTPGAIAPTASS